MIECDLHVHSLGSTCGYHTLLEIVAIMREKGLETFALTDHSPIHNTPKAHFSVLLKRMPPVIKGVRVLKGIESAILNPDGDIDLPVFDSSPYEVILAGLHPIGEFLKSMGKEKNTRAVINAMRNNPSIKVLTHPYYKAYPVDLDAVTDVALETGTALEINNSYLLTDKADTDALGLMLELAREKGNLVCVNSDGHIFNEMAEFDLALEFMKQHGLENFTIVNRTRESTLKFLGLEE